MPSPIIGAIGASLGGSLLQSKAAGDAADAQTRAANQDIAFQRETRDLIMDRVDPFYTSGLTAQDAYLYNLGLGSAPMIGGTAPTIETITAPRGGSIGPSGGSFGGSATGRNVFGGPGTAGPGRTGTQYRVGGRTFASMAEAQAYADANKVGGTQYAGFQQSPGYQWQFDQGMAGVNALAGARGGLNSGRTMKDLLTTGQGIANQEFGTYMNRLAGLTDQGLSAANLQANAATNAAAGMSNAYGNIGNAQAAGAIAQGNAWNNGIGNGIGIWQYQNALKQGGGMTTPQANPWY